MNISGTLLSYETKRRLNGLLSLFLALGLLLQLFPPPAAAAQDPAAAADQVERERSKVDSVDSVTPMELSQPLSLSRWQSAYQAGSAVVITFTVTNNQPPLLFPTIPTTATITDTINILAAFDQGRDANTMRNVTLVDTLTADATYIDSSSPPVQSGSTYTWTLGDIPPQGEAVLSLTLGTPAGVADFTDLDLGALATVDLWDVSFSDVARPAALAPDAIDPAYLARNDEVDPGDADMLWHTAALTQEPLAMFADVQAMAYEAYDGSLRGTRGTLWSAAGNALDQSSLLIAMLRASGIPARYRHGSLDTVTAQTLLATMFPAVEGVAGSLPSGTPVADPLNDPDLIALAQDHWWVEAYLPTIGWTDLDPSFAGAAVGQIFATPATDGTDRIAEVPASERHQATLRLKVEQYSSFPIAGGNLVTSYPLSLTASVPSLAGKLVTLGHFVESDAQPGLVFTSVTHTYVPFFTIDSFGPYFPGQAYLDNLSSFPLSSLFTSGLWLEFEVTDPDGEVSAYTRTVKDLIGADARIGGGAITLDQPADNGPLVSNNDLYATWILPNAVPDWVTERRAGRRISTVIAMARRAQEIDATIDFDNLSAEDEILLQDAAVELQVESTNLLGDTGLNFANQADRAMADREAGLLVKGYFPSPRIFTVGSAVNPITDEAQYNVDLRRTDVASLVYPGQAEAANSTAQWVKGVTESLLEGTILADLTGESPVTANQVFEAMAAQGLEARTLDADDLPLLATYDLSPAAYAFAAQALLDGREIVIPASPVLINGEPTLAWWEIDPQTGATIGVTEDGLHGALTETKLIWNLWGKRLPKIYKKAVEAIWNGVLEALIPALGGSPRPAAGSFYSPLSPTATVSDTWRYLGGTVCPHENCGVEQFFTDLSRQPIPLPEILFNYVFPSTGSRTNQAEVAVTGTGGGTPSFMMATVPPTSTIDPNTPAVFQADISANFTDTFTVTVTAPNGWEAAIDNLGQVTATPPRGAAPDDYAILLLAQSKTYPDLLGTSVHTATITALQDMVLDVVPEPDITLAAGDSLVAGSNSNDTNDGQPELSGLAYTVNISNTSTVSHTFEIVITGQPSAQVILNGMAGATTAQVTLLPGVERKVGLYIRPPAGLVPPPGTTYPVNVAVTALDEPTLNDSAPAAPTVPGLPFSYLAVDPPIIYATDGSTVTLDLNLSNVGNAAGDFSLDVTLPLTTWAVSNLSSPVTLNPGEGSAQSPQLTIAGAVTGDRYPVAFQSAAAGGSYTPTVEALVQIVGPNSGPIFGAADLAANACYLGNPSLSAALETLALAVASLEQSCDAGACSLAWRDQVVVAAESTASYAGGVSSLVTTEDTLQAIANDLSSRTDDADIISDLAALSGAVTTMSDELCAIAQHLPGLTMTPSNEAILPGGTMTYTLNLSNLGTVTTTYNLTVTLPAGTTTFSQTLASGATISTVYPVSTLALGLYTLQAEALAVGPGVPAGIFASAGARLNVVDRFVQVTAVTADPAFVETGVSSTSLSVEIANVANVPRSATARTTILASGGALSFTADIPLSILVGAPRQYDLTAVDTSGWAAGLYTVTVDLLDAAQALIPNGAGYGFLSVGQALGASHTLDTSLVQPGTVSVTTTITTEILADTLQPNGLAAGKAPLWPPTGLRPSPDLAGQSETLSGVEMGRPSAAQPAEVPVNRAVPGRTDQPNSQPDGVSVTPRPGSHGLLAPGFNHYEQGYAGIIYSGSWVTITGSLEAFASNGDYRRSSTAGDMATFTFTGTWAHLGFAAGPTSGLTEIFLDGASQGTIDLYRHDNEVVNAFFSGLVVTPTHTISVSVLGASNPLASDTRVQLDYVNTWDGTPLAAGLFEQDDPRLYLSANWSTVSDPVASGGTYIVDGLTNNSTAWFPFTGDTVTYQAFAYFSAREVAVSIDGVFKGYLDIASNTDVTRTYSFDGLGSGVHVIQIRHYRGEPTVDAFIVPGSPPYVTPPPPTSFTRTEEDDPAIAYNGLPYTTTATTWSRVSSFLGRASDEQVIRSKTGGDIVSYDFSGTWVHVGFVTDRDSGQAQIFIDGQDQGVVDLYNPDSDLASFAFGSLANTNHTISVTVLGTNHPNSSDTYVALDYFDTWDGTPLPSGTYEAESGALWLGGGWSQTSDPVASGGIYLSASTASDGAAWFPFTGDTISLVTLANFRSDRVKVYVDGVERGVVRQYSGATITRTFSLDGLGAGPHVLAVHQYYEEAHIDALVTPGVPPFYQPPTYTGIVRYEEDHPALLFNGYPRTQRPQSWSRSILAQVSEGGIVSSATAGDELSLTFDGRWVNIGFRTRNRGGQAEISIDGISHGTVGLYSASEDVRSFQVGGLITGTHTLSITVLGVPDPPSTQANVYVDYIDIWDGTVMPDGYINARRDTPNGRTHVTVSTDDVVDPNAFQGDYVKAGLLNSNANVWYTFTGDSFTLLAFTRKNGGTADVYLDGQQIDTIDITYPFTEQPLAFHYTGFSDGPHVVRVHNGLYLQVDAFASNPPDLTPYQPIVEWYDDTPRGNGAPAFGTVGIGAGVAAGDVTGDGNVEIVVTADDLMNFGTLYVYRGDGQDAGGGSPIIWSDNIGGGAYRTWVGSPAIADLDGQPGAEIVVAAGSTLRAYHSDGTLYWITNTVPIFETASSPAIANLDADPLPEIVVNLGDWVGIYEPDGTLIWENLFPAHTNPPLLADMTGDGLLDIIVTAWSDTVYLYDFNFGSPTLVWSTVLTSTMAGMFGSPAVGDVDGQQPGGDPGPEIAVTSDGRVNVLDADGSFVWSTVLDAGEPGGSSLADVDGDGEIEIVTSIKYNNGQVYVLNADGTLLWSAQATDSTSANSSSVLDLDGDDIYEVAWNGKEQGFTIFNGADGAVLFNEPEVFSLTGTDYPAIADVDLDGFAEIIAPGLYGLHVIGYDGGWASARPLWNQHSYHITNINDDLSVPFSEPNSWDVHNTYRTQTSLTNPLPVYQVALTHTVGVSGVVVLTDTFSSPPNANPPDYDWEYSQLWYQPVLTTSFASELSDLQPGEARLVAQGTEILYTLSSGSNRLALPPLYTTAAHIVSLSPLTHTIGAGGTAVYSLTLSNPGPLTDTYTLALGGLPAPWFSLPPTVTIPAGGVVALSLAVNVPATTDPADMLFTVYATNTSGGVDQAGAGLTIVDLLDVSISPAQQTAPAGLPVSYTLTLTNTGLTADTYHLLADGLASVTLPPTVTVPAGGVQSLTFFASAPANGPHPFTVAAAGDQAGDQADALLDATGGRLVGLALAPAIGYSGPGMPTVYTLTVSNLGQTYDTYTLTVNLPIGWGAGLSINGLAVDSVSLPPYVFNSADVLLAITPPAGTSPGAYTFGVTAESQGIPGVQTHITGTLQVLTRGVQVAVTPAATTMDPTETGLWQVTITNTGSVADSYVLTATGIAALSPAFSTNPVTLNPGQAQTIQLTADDLDFALPTIYPLAVTAQSLADDRVQGEGRATVAFIGYEEGVIAWRPASQTVTNTLTATFLMVISNTGNVATSYTFTSDLGLLSGGLPVSQYVIPPHFAAALAIEVTAPGPGVYTLLGSASSAGGVNASSTATLTVISTNQPPTALAGPNQAVDEGDLVSFNGTANDPEGGPLTIHWDFGDGASASGTLTPTHVYDDNDQYLVTLVVTDDLGLSASDSLTVSVANVAPLVEAGANQNVGEGDTVFLDPATFTDPGAADTHTAVINWGDGTVEAGTVDQMTDTVSGSHVYAAAGQYTVTVTVTDDDGAEGSDTFNVTVTATTFYLYLPAAFAGN